MNFLQITATPKFFFLVPEIINENFDIIKCPYPLRNEFRFMTQNICPVKYGTETAAFVGSMIWSYMPD